MHSGRRQLRAWMTRQAMNQAQLAEFLGWSESAISQYLSGARVPELENAVKIEAATGIPCRAWMVDDVHELAAAAAGGTKTRKLHGK